MASKSTLVTIAFAAGATAGLAIGQLLRPNSALAERHRLAFQLGRRLLDAMIESLPPAQGIGRL